MTANIADRSAVNSYMLVFNHRNHHNSHAIKPIATRVRAIVPANGHTVPARKSMVATNATTIKSPKNKPTALTALTMLATAPPPHQTGTGLAH